MNEENLKTKLGKEYRKKTIKGEETEVDSSEDEHEFNSEKAPQIITDKELEGSKENNFTQK